MIRVVKTQFDETAHAADFCRLMQVYATDVMGGGHALSSEVLTRLVPAIRARPFVDVLPAYRDEECLGMATLIEGFSTFQAAPLLNIHDMVVAATHRGQGISHALLAEAEAEARRRGCCKLTLEVLSENHVAKASYRSFGFEDYTLDPSAGHALFWQKRL